MAPGTYRAVSETGVTFELTIYGNSNVVPREFHIADFFRRNSLVLCPHSASKVNL